MKPPCPEDPVAPAVELGELLGKLVHRARNPLATIRSSAQLVQHLTRPTGEVAEYLEGILAEVDGLDAVLRDLRRYVRLVPQRAEVLDAEELALEAVAGVRQAAREAGVALEVSRGPRLPVWGDREQLCGALVELLSNAVRCTAQQRAVTAGWSEGGAGEVRLFVDDGCPGIGPEVAERMFQPFYSGDGRGTGLGLNLAARAAALAGGRLEWARRPGQGCRFALVLRRA